MIVIFTGFVYVMAGLSASGWPSTTLYTPILELTENSCLEFSSKFIDRITFLARLCGKQNEIILENRVGLGKNKVL